MKYKLNESGKSMIQTIAMVGGIVLLIYGTTGEIGNLLASAQLENVNKRILALATERQIKMSHLQQGAFKHSEDGPYGIKLTIENGITEQDSDVFWIQTSHIQSKALSQKISDYYLKNKYAQKVESFEKDGFHEVKIYFPKFPA